jgi:hypothetical protein
MTTTASVDRIQPATVKAQNGMTSRRRWARPRLPHTQYLFSRNAGIEMMLTATKLAHPGFMSRACSMMNSRMFVVTTPNNETVE